MAKRGRPPTPKAEALSEIVPVRMTTAERQRYERAAGKADKRLSEWIRDCLARAARNVPKRG